MIVEYHSLFIVLCAIPIGILAGMMPGVPTSVVLLLTFPVIYNLPFDFLIAFYAAVAICTQFSNSVVAIYAGIPGDLTALPVVRERDNLLRLFSLKENLYRTAVASVFGTLVAFLILLFFVRYLSQYSIFLLRTEVLFSAMLIIFVGCIFWPNNSPLTNFIIAIIGGIIGIVGFNNILLIDFLTFNNSYLYGGIPIFPAFIALYAMPNLLKLNKQKKSYTLATDSVELSFISGQKNGKAVLLGSLTGSIAGLVPLLGTYSSSSVAYWFAKKLKFNSINRVICSESSNSAAFIIVLAPLLVFGIAIVPSELILLNLLSVNGWVIEDVTPKTLYFLAGVSFVSVVFGYYSCTKLARPLVNFIANSGSWMPWIFFLTLLVNVYIMAGYTNEEGIYFITFILCSLVSLFFNKNNIDPVPLIFSWAIGEQLIATSVRMLNLYS